MNIKTTDIGVNYICIEIVGRLNYPKKYSKVYGLEIFQIYRMCNMFFNKMVSINKSSMLTAI